MKKHIYINTDELQYYLKDLRKIPVIPNERQLEIFELLKNKKLPLKEQDELKKEMVLGNLRFVITIAKGYQNQGLDLMDLISEGNIGVLKAIERYDPLKNEGVGVKFISYAVWWIRQSILASLNEYGRTIRIPSNLIQEIQKQKKVIEPYSEDVNFSLPFCVGLDDTINEEGQIIFDTIIDPNQNNPDDILNTKEEIKKRISNILQVLDERERCIIEKYFGLNGIESNLEDLGDEFSCSKERIRQLKDRAIKKLRNESYLLVKYL